MRRAVFALLAVVAVTGMLFLFVLPGRALLDQSRSLAQTKQRIAVLQRENAKLAARAAQLQSDSKIEQLAHQEYGLVLPGQQAYGVIPPTAAGGATTTTTTTTPAVATSP